MHAWDHRQLLHWSPVQALPLAFALFTGPPRVARCGFCPSLALFISIIGGRGGCGCKIAIVAEPAFAAAEDETRARALVCGNKRRKSRRHGSRHAVPRVLALLLAPVAVALAPCQPTMLPLRRQLPPPPPPPPPQPQLPPPPQPRPHRGGESGCHRGGASGCGHGRGGGRGVPVDLRVRFDHRDRSAINLAGKRSTDAAESGRLVASPTTRDDAVLAGGRALVLQVAAGSPNGSPDDDALMSPEPSRDSRRATRVPRRKITKVCKGVK